MNMNSATKLQIDRYCFAGLFYSKNHLWAQYGVYFTNNRTILRRPYGARPAAGRIVRLFIMF